MSNKITNVRRPDPIINPDGYGDVDQGRIYAAVQPVDKIASDMETKWGVGRLVKLVTVETAAKFGAATEKLNKAIAQDDADEVEKRAKVMVRAWTALDAEATAKGATTIGDELTAWVATDDNGNAFTVVRTLPEATECVKRGVEGRVYHLEEIARLIKLVEDRAPGVQIAKETFPFGNVTAVRSKADDGHQDDLNDPIPF